MKTPLLFALGCVAAPAAFAQDAVQTDGDKYRVVIENDCVRVLDYQDQPGAVTHPHRHPPFVLVALGPFKRTLTLPDGKVVTREFKGGEAMWADAQAHVGANVGTTPTHVMMVELKPAAGCSAR